MQEMFGDGESVLRFLPHLLRRRRRRSAERTARPRGRGARRAAAPGPRRRAGDRAGLEDAYHGATRRLVDQARRPGAHGRRADSGRRRRRIARARRRRRRARAPAARSRATSTCAIRLAPHPTLRAQGHGPLHARAVPLTTAVLGGEAEVQTLGGKSLRLKIPPTTQNGQVFRLKGHGMPVVGKPDEHGRSLRDGRRAAAEHADARAADALRGAAETGEGATHSSAKLARRRGSSVEASENDDEHQQVHRKSAGSRARRASELAEQLNNPQIEPEHLLVALVEQREGIVPELLRKMDADPAHVGRARARAARQDCRQAYGGSQPGLSPRLKLVTDLARGRSRAAEGRVRQHRAPASSPSPPKAAAPPPRSCSKQRGITRDTIFAGADERPRIAARDDPEPRGHLSGARALRPRPHRAGAQEASSIR